MNLFQTYQWRQAISNNIGFAHSFVAIVEMNAPLYYVMNYNQLNILVYNENWGYQRTFKINNSFLPTYSIDINGVIYIAGSFGIQKYDKYLNLTKEVLSFGYERGIY
jgi:hypothetical protein